MDVAELLSKVGIEADGKTETAGVWGGVWGGGEGKGSGRIGGGEVWGDESASVRVLT